jgi:hypothetical protein
LARAFQALRTRNRRHDRGEIGELLRLERHTWFRMTSPTNLSGRRSPLVPCPMRPGLILS